MNYTEIKLSGTNQKELDTEIKYCIASTKADSIDFVRLDIPSSFEQKRIVHCAIRVLSTMRREGTVMFYVTAADLKEQTTEAKYLINKHPEVLDYEDGEYIGLFVKL